LNSALTPSIARFLSYLSDSAPKTALDIGCGTGQLTCELWYRGFKTIGIELEKKWFDMALSRMGA